MAEPLIRLSGAVFGYGQRAVVRVEELRVAPGQCLGIYGANGSGKSTLLKGLAGMLAPQAGGAVRVEDLRIGYVPQRQAIDPHWPMTGLDAAGLASSAASWLGWLGRRKTSILGEMRRFGVAGLAGRAFATLSGGQQQRVLLAGALASNPQVLLLDEPAEGLDTAGTRAFLDLLRSEAARGVAVVVISHEIAELAHVAEEVAWIRPAATEHDPSVLTLLPQSAFAAAVMGGLA